MMLIDVQKLNSDKSLQVYSKLTNFIAISFKEYYC